MKVIGGCMSRPYDLVAAMPARFAPCVQNVMCTPYKSQLSVRGRFESKPAFPPPLAVQRGLCRLKGCMTTRNVERLAMVVQDYAFEFYKPPWGSTLHFTLLHIADSTSGRVIRVDSSKLARRSVDSDVHTLLFYTSICMFISISQCKPVLRIPYCTAAQ